MNKKTVFFLMTGILLLVTLVGAFLQSSDDLFQKALRLERNEGNLKEAIALYKQVVDKAKDKSLAAQAQLRIGFCYEKMGLSEAEKAFQAVIDKFPGQTDAVKTAREKLSSIQEARTTVEKTSREFTIKKIWTGPETDGLGKISPDGRFFGYTDWITGDLAVLEISTGKKRRLTNKGSWMKSSEFALFLAWSPDGKQIVYNWWGEDSYVDMRVIEASGSKPPRTVHNLKNPKKGGGFVIGWTPDGKSVVAAFAEKGGLRGWLNLVSMENGSVRTIKEMASIQPVTLLLGGCRMEKLCSSKAIVKEPMISGPLL
jgi:Tol biopolymer transport system component